MTTGVLRPARTYRQAWLRGVGNRVLVALNESPDGLNISDVVRDGSPAALGGTTNRYIYLKITARWTSDQTTKRDRKE